MAQLPNQQGFPLNHQPVLIVQQLVPQNVGNLKGSGPRRAMGSLIIACGCAQIVLSICLLILLRPYGFFDGHWGIWNGVFAIITGSFGLVSARKKSMVITFMVLAINAAVLCALCCVIQGIFSRYSSLAPLVLFIIIGLSYGLQFLFCIIGASFTCVAFSCGVPYQGITYPPHAMPPGQAYEATPYTGAVNMAMQPAAFNVGSDEGLPTNDLVTAQPNI
ncbi:uncharacterized protein [Apostichopus japonicus]|uniref:uncharacterized protein n=1 Tax=Stichopus japonicus TaxID=307972 RepID=UPI003AB8768B